MSSASEDNNMLFKSWIKKPLVQPSWPFASMLRLQYYNITILQYYNITTSQYHNITISQYHNITISQYHNITIFKSSPSWVGISSASSAIAKYGCHVVAPSHWFNDGILPHGTNARHIFNVSEFALFLPSENPRNKNCRPAGH